MTVRLQKGMTLIELMIGVVISMVLSIAVLGVMSTFEGRRRTMGSASDLDQSGNVAMFKLDRWIRSAGTGIEQGNAHTYGCKLFATYLSTGQLLPMTAAIPAPFANVNPGATGVFRLAPVIILPGQTTPGSSGHISDVLVIMSSGNDGSQVPMTFTLPPTATQLNVTNTTEFSPSDLVLVADGQPAANGGPANCMVTQASPALATTGNVMALSGNYYAATIGSASIANFTDSGLAIDLGNISTTTRGALPPSFQVIGVGNNNTLYSYDLLQTTTTPLQAQASGVFELHALYGVDSTGNINNEIDSWVNASTTSAYSVAALSAGTSTAASLLKNIRAVRVGLIMRTALPEKDIVTPGGSLTLFSDLGAALTVTRTLSTAEQHYRYRTIEATIPVRNNKF